MEFVQVPRNLIEDQAIGDKRVLVYLSISFSKWTGCKVDELTTFCGYSADNRHSGSAGQQIRNIVAQLISRGYLTSHANQMRFTTFNDCFGAIYYDEFDKIMRTTKSTRVGDHRVNHAHLLLLLSCIRCYMIHTTGAPQIYSNLLKRISEHIGISVRSISNCIRALEDLEIIHSEELPRYKDSNGNWHSNVRIFVNRQSRYNPNHTYDWQQETKRGINMILANQLS